MPIAVRYLARRDRTTAQVEGFLRHKGAPPAHVREIITRLSHLRYLDDRAYAQRWVEARLARRPMGRARLEAELSGQGIAETVALQAIHGALHNLDEDTLARRVLASVRRPGRRFTPQQAVRLLRQRGFEEETVERIMGRHIEDKDSAS